MSAPIPRRRLLQGVAAALAGGYPARAALAQVPQGEREAMARAATAFLATLDEGRRRRTVFAFADPERTNWHYVPRRREGLPFKDMAAPSRAAAHELMKAALSATGYAKAANVIRLEEVLRQVESLGFMMRDPENYSLTVFGAPEAAAPWGWRLEGHHLSLNFTVPSGRPLGVTPAFFGANPALVGTGPHKGLRTLKDEQDLGLALARSVDAALRPRMVIAASAPGDVVAGPGRNESLRTPQGLPLADLSTDQRAQALRLVEVYARNMRGEIGDRELERARAAGVERLHFAWAGALDAGQPHYYRLHGPTLLIEYDNTQNGANHIHSVWRDPRGDFGADPLAAHYRHHHHGSGGRA
jgi:hypothetical protein